MAAVPAERIESPSFMLRGHKVMLSPDLAELYEVEPGALVQAVKRNIERFPADFMFQLSPGELVGTDFAARPRMPSPNRVSPCSPAKYCDTPKRDTRMVPLSRRRA